MYAQCDQHNDNWTGLDEAESFHRKYPFVSNAIKSIKTLVGEDMFGELQDYSMEYQFRWRKLVDLQHLCMKIEGRKCAYSVCSNQENRDGVIEKYKMCSTCRIAFYCSRRCQKRDWKQGHKNDCNTNRYFTEIDSDYCFSTS